MGTTILKQMSWKEAKEFIEGRLNRLAMCKRGALATDIDEQRKKLGERPKFTKDEIKDIEAKLIETIAKKVKLTKTIIKKYNGDSDRIGSHIEREIDKVRKGVFIHPDLKKWEADHDMIMQQKDAREAQLDADFRDLLDDFILGSKEISDFPTEYDKMEARSW